jgi:hypothetical protein
VARPRSPAGSQLQMTRALAGKAAASLMLTEITAQPANSDSRRRPSKLSGHSKGLPRKSAPVAAQTCPPATRRELAQPHNPAQKH